MVTIPSGKSTASISLIPLDDALLDGDKSVTLTLRNTEAGEYAGYEIGTGSATALVLDDEFSVWIVAGDDAYEENEQSGWYTIHRAGRYLQDPLSVSYAKSGGDAIFDLDYSDPANMGSVSFGANESVTTLYVDPIDEPFDDGDKDLEITLQPGFRTVITGPTATIAIIDNDDPIVVVRALDPISAEDPNTTALFRTVALGSPVSATLQLDGTAQSGIDYPTIPTAVSGNAGFTLLPTRNDSDEDQESVLFHLTPGVDTEVAGVARGLIIDDPASSSTANGSFNWTSSSIGACGCGGDFAFATEATNQPKDSVNSPIDTTSNVSSLGRVSADGDSRTIHFGSTALAFDPASGGGWYPREFSRNQLTHDPLTHQFTLALESGIRYIFNDLSDFWPVAARGRFQAKIDLSGNPTEVVSETPEGRILDIQRTVTMPGMTGYESFLFGWSPSGEKLTSVTLRRRMDNQPWTTIEQLTYDYYGSGSSYGNEGDLRQAIVKDGDGALRNRDYYRYTTTAPMGTFAGRLKHAIGTLGYARLANLFGNDPELWSDAQVNLFAEQRFTYDSEGRLASMTQAGAGNDAGGFGTSTYSYAESNFGGQINHWRTKKAETLPNGTTVSTYRNSRGQTLLSAVQAVGSTDVWLSYNRYDGYGNVVLSAGSDVVSGYDELLPDLVGYTNGNATHLHDTAGAVVHYDYADSTTATFDTPGSVTARLEQVAISRGETGSPITQGSVNYYSRTDGFGTIYPVAQSTSYPNQYSAVTTEYAYTWHPGTLRAQTVTTTLPELQHGGYGLGIEPEYAVEYDILGQARWMRDPLGYLSYAEYDAATGAMTLQINDADTTQLTQQPVLAWTTPANGGQHVVTSQEVDGFGRPTKITTPGGIESFIVYNQANNEVRQYAAWNDTLNAPTGLTSVMREDWGQGYVESLQISAAPATSNGEPTWTEPITGIVALSRTQLTPGGQVDFSDAYFNLAGLSLSTATNLGTEGTHFLRTRYGYGTLGEANRVESSDGSIARSVIDGLGRTLGEWIGSDDSVTGVWSPSNPGLMEQITSYEYDNGGVGIGNLTAMTTHTGSSSPDRNQAIQYDWRGRPVLTLEGVGVTGDINRALTYVTYNNSSQATSVELFDGDTHTLADPSTFPNGVPARPATSLRRAWSETEYDNYGRAWHAIDHPINQTDGTVGFIFPEAESWVNFDLRGLPMAAGSAGNPTQRTVYDGLGQVSKSYVVTGYNYFNYYYNGFNPDDVSNETVWMQSEYSYDDRLNMTDVTSRERNFGTSLQGDLGNGVPHRATYAGAYYDDLGRMTASVDVGTNGGAAWTRPTTLPARSDSTHVSSVSFDDANRITTMTDPRGISYRSTSDALGRTLSETAAFGTIDKFTSTASYNSLGQLASTTSPGNLTTNYGYDSLGRMTSMTDPAGFINSVSTNRLGEAITSTDPTGLVTTTNLDALGRATSMSMANGGSTRSLSATYDVLGRTLSVTDPRGNSALMAYHDEARYVESTDAEGHTSRTDYDVAGNTTKLTNPFNQSWTATYDPLNRLVSTSDPLLHGISVERNRSGDRTRITDAVGRTSEQVVDAFGRSDSVIDGYGVTVAEYGYDRNSQVNEFTDALGNITQMSHDNLGRTTTVTEAVGTSLQRSSQVGYHVTGQAETMTDPLGNVTKYGFDSAGRTISVTAAFGQPEAMTATQSYDSAGRPSISTAPGGLQAKTDYTPFSEVASVTQAYGHALARTTSFGYDANGNRTSVTDPLGNVSTTGYDKRNLPTTFTDALNGVTTQAYDAAGRLLSITDPVNNKTQYAYYADDILQAVTDPLGKVTSYTYYSDDMVQQKTDRLGRTSDYVYDKNARLVSEIWKDDQGVTVDTRSFGYDVAGNLLTASNDAGAYSFTYDALNRVSTVNQPFGLTLTNVYDAADNRISVTDNKGGVTTSTYDGLNRLTSRELSGTGITPLKAIWDYDTAGNVSKLTRQTNGVTVGTTDTSHDILYRTTEIHHKDAAGVTLGKYEYTSYDAGDRLLSQTIDGVVTNYNYDKTNQLTQDGATSYTYDANGNRTQGSYTVGPNNQIITDGTWTYSYDNASQTSSKSDGLTTWTYNYDHNGQMVAAGNGSDTVEYTYDVFGNRIQRSHDDGSTVDVERFAFDGGDTAKPRPIGNEQFDTYADLDASNNVTMRRMYGAGFDELVVRRDAAGNAGWYLQDKLNSVRAIADDAGTVVARATYSAFGESVTTGAIDRFQFTSRELDGTIELQYSRARVYNPSTGRFLNEDPVGFAAGDANLGRYVGNRTTNGSDPSGMEDPSGSQGAFTADWFYDTSSQSNQFNPSNGIIRSAWQEFFKRTLLDVPDLDTDSNFNQMDWNGDWVVDPDEFFAFQVAASTNPDQYSGTILLLKQIDSAYAKYANKPNGYRLRGKANGPSWSGDLTDLRYPNWVYEHITSDQYAMAKQRISYTEDTWAQYGSFAVQFNLDNRNTPYFDYYHKAVFRDNRLLNNIARRIEWILNNPALSERYQAEACELRGMYLDIVEDDKFLDDEIFGKNYDRVGDIVQILLNDISDSERMEAIHQLLDAAGLVPGFGEVFDFINAGLYLAEGDYVNAALSGGAIIPIYGSVFIVGKYGRRGVKFVSKYRIKLDIPKNQLRSQILPVPIPSVTITRNVPVTNSRTLTFKHRLKPNRTTDQAALRQEIQLHVDAWNNIIRKEGMQGLKRRLRQYEEFGTEIEAVGRRYTRSLGSAGQGQAWPHYPDMSTGGRPKTAVGSPADRRLNSIIGGQTDRLRREILDMPDDVTDLRFDLDLK